MRISENDAPENDPGTGSLFFNATSLLAVITMFLLLMSTPSCAQKKNTSSMRTVQSKTGTINVEHLATLKEPWGMTFLPDGRLLVTEKPGRLRFYSDGKLSEPITGLPTVAYGGQGGLMDVELHPDFATNSLVYIYFVEHGNDDEMKGGAVARARLDGSALRELKVIWRQNLKVTGSGHFGGRLVFAPDKTLFITSGERQKFQPAQDTTLNLGKIIRINPDGSIPSDNPFVNKKGNLPETYTMGHRNPLGAAINPATKQLWINEMGPLGGDEINIIQPGKNYGWPIVSNGNNYDRTDIPDHPTRPEFEAPIYFWNPVISPSGMIFYTGTLFPGWRGNALLGGLSGQALILMVTDGDQVKEEDRIDMNKRIRDVIEAPDGSIWILTDYKDGELLRLSPAK